MIHESYNAIRNMILPHGYGLLGEVHVNTSDLLGVRNAATNHSAMIRYDRAKIIPIINAYLGIALCDLWCV